MKIKQHKFTPYPMPDSFIKKVEHFGRSGAPAGIFDFADRSGILFKWNDKVDESPQKLVKNDVIPYPSLAAGIPGVPLTRDQSGPTAKDNIPVQGHTKNKAAQNAGLGLLNIAGVDLAAIIHAHDN
jgi:hypothetical protein